MLGKISGQPDGTRMVGHVDINYIIWFNALPLVFAQQGYFVVAINPTGSTTFGQGQHKHIIRMS